MTAAIEKLFDFEGAVAVVTGGGSGIGKATASLLAQAGAKVVIVDRDQSAGESAASSIIAQGGSAFAATADITDEPAVEKLFADTVKREGHIDVVVSNAGIAIRKPAVELSLPDWDRVVAVNMTGIFLCARAAARHMIDAKRGGAIINTASIMGLSGGGLYPNISYQTTKGAVVNMTRALAVEWAPHGVTVNGIVPGVFRTDLNSHLLDSPRGQELLMRTPMHRYGNLEELVGATVFLASDAAGFVTGQLLAVDGGFLASGVNQ